MPGSSRAAPHALLAGGGTGGHVFPGLAVAEELLRRGWQVSWAGRQSGIEARLVGARGLPFAHLPARAVVGRSAPQRLQAMGTLAASAWRGRRLIRRLDARVVLGTGGFVAAPAVLGARLARRPAVLLEPNAEAGAANRWLSRWAGAAAIGYAETASQLRCPARHTGVPVRSAFFAVPDRPPSPPPLRVLILGGSQGALQLNELLPPALALAAPELPPLAVLHQVGELHLAVTRQAYAAARVPGAAVEIVPFLDDVASAMGAAHLVVSRAGAVTLAEICAAGRAALLVPLAVAEGHQAANAERLAASGGASVVPHAEASAPALAARLRRLLGDVERLARMGEKLRRLARPDAAARIVDLMETEAEAA